MSIPAYPLLILTLVVTSVMCMFVNSWLAIWILLEMNTLSFCSMMKTFSKSKSNMSESSMKYFIIQSIASALLFFSSISMKMEKSFVVIFLFMSILSLLIKMAASPFQEWFVKMVKNIKWKNSTVLMTWQKLAPVYLILFQMKKVLWSFLILSALLGAVSQMNKKVFKEIMAFSSVFNLSWMLLAVVNSMKIFILFTTIYWSSVGLMIYMIKLSKMKSLNMESKESTKKWINFSIILNLGGIPPMAGFLAKWVVFSSSLTKSLMLITTLLLVMSSINFYIYTRLLSSNVLNKTTKTQKSNKQTNKKLSKTVLLINSYPLMMMTM